MLATFFLVQLPMGHESDIEERIIRHLAAAASMRRAHHLGQRESQRTRSSAHGHPHYFVYSTQHSAPSSAAGGGSEPAVIPAGNPSAPLVFGGTEQSSPEQMPLFQTRNSSLTSGSTVTTTNLQGVHSNDRLLDFNIYFLVDYYQCMIMWSYTLYIYVFVEALPLNPCLQAMMNHSHQNNHSQILSFPDLMRYPWGTIS